MFRRPYACVWKYAGTLTCRSGSRGPVSEDLSGNADPPTRTGSVWLRRFKIAFLAPSRSCSLCSSSNRCSRSSAGNAQVYPPLYLLSGYCVGWCACWLVRFGIWGFSWTFGLFLVWCFAERGPNREKKLIYFSGSMYCNTPFPEFPTEFYTQLVTVTSESPSGALSNIRLISVMWSLCFLPS